MRFCIAEGAPLPDPDDLPPGVVSVGPGPQYDYTSMAEAMEVEQLKSDPAHTILCYPMVGPSRARESIYYTR